VSHFYSNFYTVHTPWGELTCHTRAILKKQGQTVLSGDVVSVVAIDWHTRTGWIKSILPRHNQLERPSVANVDGVLIVMACQQPELSTLALDKLLTNAHRHGVKPLLLLTKADLLTDAPEADAVLATAQRYQALGIPTWLASNLPQTKAPLATPHVWQQLAQHLQGQRWVLAGPSGVGKSSLLNRLTPALACGVGQVSAKLARGQHTTRHVRWLKVEFAPYLHSPATCWLADTPGFSLLSMAGVEPTQLEQSFAEFAPHKATCAFADCLHEAPPPPPADNANDVPPVCGVRMALAQGAIDPDRYANYLAMLAEAQASPPVAGTLLPAVQHAQLGQRHRATSRRRSKQTLASYQNDDDTDNDDSFR
jgi:ribosome biogenesis GTPase